jgi:sugar O-acyltransferase (sialic acid O-acetyltransferase NeuD family)
MKNKKMIIYGVGRFAEFSAYVFDNDSEFEVVAFCIENNYLKDNNHFEKEILGKPVIAFEKIQDSFKNEKLNLFIAVGNNIIRERIFTTAKNKDYCLVSYISSKAQYWTNLKIGENCFIGEGSIIQPFTKIGDNSILFSSRIGHHSTIGDHTLLSSCLLGGNVKIGKSSFLGLNSTIKENTTIGENNVIGMSSTINFDTGNNEIYTSPIAKKRKITYQQFYKKLLP